jgi:hypothetical protein
LIKV